MKRIRIAQITLVFGMTAGLAFSLPSLFLRGNGAQEQQGLILVNGRIEGTEVAVGSKLAGRVVSVKVDEGQEVKAGQLIAELETEDVRALCDQARANVSRATHNLASSKEQVIGAEQQLAKAEVALELAKTQIALSIRQSETAVREVDAGVTQAQALHHKAQTQFEHARQLHKEQAASDLELTFAQDALKAQAAAVEMAQHRREQSAEALKLAQSRTSEITIRGHELAMAQSTVRQAMAMVGVANAQLQAAQAALTSCEIQLKDSRIFAPSDGVVVTRAAEPGEVIGAGSCVAVIVDFDKLYLKGYLPNTLVGKLKHGDAARIHLDAFPNKHFNAKITKINQQAEFTPKHVDTPQQRVTLVFGVEMTISNTQRLVKPGIPADGVIRLDENAKWQTPSDLR